MTRLVGPVGFTTGIMDNLQILVIHFYPFSYHVFCILNNSYDRQVYIDLTYLNMSIYKGIIFLWTTFNHLIFDTWMDENDQNYFHSSHFFFETYI